jgi:hypothetical protein
MASTVACEPVTPTAGPEFPPGIRPVRLQDWLTSNRRAYFRYELRGQEGEPKGALDGVVASGSLEYDYTARLKAGGKIRIMDVGQDIDWLHDRIYVEAVVGDVAWGLGLYLPTAPIEQWGAGHRAWDVELHSKLLVLEQDCVPTSYSLGGGTNTINAVRTLITSAGEDAGAITDSAEVLLQAMTWEAGTPKLTIINNLLDASGYFVLQVDGLGNYRALPYVVPAQRPVRYTFEDGATAIYQDTFPRDQDIFEVPNRIIAIGQGTGAKAAMVATADNVDPTSPFSFPSRGRWISRTYTGVEATSQNALNTYARKMLVDWSAPTATVTVDHALIPLSPYDAVQFVYSLGELNSRHVVDKITVQLDPTKLCRTLLRQVVTY